MQSVLCKILHCVFYLVQNLMVWIMHMYPINAANPTQMGVKGMRWDWLSPFNLEVYSFAVTWLYWLLSSSGRKMSSLGTSKGILEIAKFGVYVTVPIVLMYTFANNTNNYLHKFIGKVINLFSLSIPFFSLYFSQFIWDMFYSFPMGFGRCIIWD